MGDRWDEGPLKNWIKWILIVLIGGGALCCKLRESSDQNADKKAVDERRSDTALDEKRKRVDAAVMSYAEQRFGQDAEVGSWKVVDAAQHYGAVEARIWREGWGWRLYTLVLDSDFTVLKCTRKD